jgi:hypothetical protein
MSNLDYQATVSIDVEEMDRLVQGRLIEALEYAIKEEDFEMQGHYRAVIKCFSHPLQWREFIKEFGDFKDSR